MDLVKKGVKLTLRQERMREKDKLKGGIVDSKYSFEGEERTFN